jgi:hypothetical protein
MKKPKTKLKRNRARKSAAISPKPAAKKKRNVATQRAGSNPKVSGTAAVPHPRSTAAVPRPELEPIPTRPLFAAPRDYQFLGGGGVAMPAGFLPDGFVLASAKKPAGYRIVEFRTFRTAPEGEYVKCVRYELKAGSVAEVREPVRDLKGDDMAHIPVGHFFIHNGNGGPILSVRCTCSKGSLLRIGKAGKATCSKCGLTFTAPTDLVGLPVMNSRAMNESFSPSALPRERYHNFVKIV